MLRLVDGIAFHEDIYQGRYEQFEFDVNDASLDLTVTVTALGRGDPDLYISTSPNPSRDNYIWAATSYMADSITIPHTHPRYKAGPFYISVHAYSNVSFTIMARLRQTVELQNGVPQSGFVAKEAMVYYTMLLVPDGQTATFALNVRQGYASMYVSTTQQPIPTNASTYQNSVTWWQAVKSITTPAITAANYPVDSDGQVLFYIGIYGAADANFTVTAFTSSQMVQLVSGQSVYRTVTQNTYNYFFIAVQSGNQDLSIIVTPVTGDPDLYVSQAPQFNPTRQSHQFQGINWGGDIVDIDNANVTVYYIGVHAFTNTTFTLMVQLSQHNSDPLSNAVILYDGVPQVGYAHSHHVQYYSFMLQTQASRVTFNLVRSYVCRLQSRSHCDKQRWQVRWHGQRCHQLVQCATGFLHRHGKWIHHISMDYHDFHGGNANVASGRCCRSQLCFARRK